MEQLERQIASVRSAILRRAAIGDRLGNTEFPENVLTVYELTVTLTFARTVTFVFIRSLMNCGLQKLCTVGLLWGCDTDLET